MPGVDEIEIEELRAAPADGGAVHCCNKYFGVTQQLGRECLACSDFLIDGRTVLARRDQDFSGAVVFAGAGLDDDFYGGFGARPGEGGGEVVVLLDGEGVGDFGLVVGEEDGVGGDRRDDDGL